MSSVAKCPKVQKGQIWQKNDGITKGRKVCITGKAKSRKGQIAWHTKDIDNVKAKAHAMTQKTLWKFYSLVGHIGRNQL